MSVAALALVIRLSTAANMDVAAVLVGGLGLCALAAGWWINGRGRSPAMRAAWRYLTLSMVVTALTTVVATLQPGDVGGVLLLRAVAAVTAAIGLLALIRERLEDKPAEAVAEAVMVAAAIGYLLFAIVVVPGSPNGWGTPVRVAAFLVPLADLVVVTLSLRLVSFTDRHPVAYRYVMGAFACLVVADSVNAGAILGHHHPMAGAVIGLDLWAICLVGAGALHPSRRMGFDPVPLRASKLTRAQLTAIAFTLGVVPLVFVIDAIRHVTMHMSVALIGTAVLPLLVSAYLVRQVFARAAAEYRAQHDPLTGLCNRVLFEDRLESALEHARANGGHVGVMFLDLDRFKSVNDSLGHTVGNQLLIDVAKRLQASVRDMDTVSRLGGDEFTLVLPAIDGKQECAAVAERVLAGFTHAFSAGGRPLNVKTSIGVAVYPHDGDNAETLIKNADTAMYRAKAAGRGTFTIYDAQMSSRAQLRFALEASLRLAISREQLAVHYQPKVEADSGRIVGVEALARWNHPRLGFISPWAFISLAEETGQIAAVGGWVLETACRQARRWQEQGTPLPVAVNLSSCQFEETPIVRVVEDVLHRTGLDPGLLELEVTENLLVKDIESVTHSLWELRRLGVRCSIDDFGTGYSALSYLAQMPVNSLKIDRSFVGRISSEATQAAIVNAVIALAHSLELEVVAEGVETPEQLSILRAQGCEQVQGYLFSPPMPADQLDPLLQGKLHVVRNRATAASSGARPVVAPAALNSLLEAIVADRGADAALNLGTVQTVLAALLADQPIAADAARRLHTLPARLAAGTFAGLVPLSGGLAAAGALPAPLQALAAEAFEPVGAVIPSVAHPGVVDLAAARGPRRVTVVPASHEVSHPAPAGNATAPPPPSSPHSTPRGANAPVSARGAHPVGAGGARPGAGVVTPAAGATPAVPAGNGPTPVAPAGPGGGVGGPVPAPGHGTGAANGQGAGTANGQGAGAPNRQGAGAANGLGQGGGAVNGQGAGAANGQGAGAANGAANGNAGTPPVAPGIQSTVDVPAPAPQQPATPAAPPQTNRP